MGLLSSLKNRLFSIQQTEASVEQANLGANPEWKAEALEAIYEIASTKPEFTTDEVWVRLTTKTPENRAMGAVMRIAVSQGYIVPSARFTPSLRPSQHRRPLRVWESVIYP
jgi:hypothetical protein